MKTLFNKFLFLYHRHGFLFYVILFLGIFVTIYIGQLVYYTLSTKIRSFTEERRQREAKSISALKYQELLDKQAALPDDVTVTPIPKRTARGTMPVNIIFVKPQPLSDISIVSLIETLKDSRRDLFNTCDAAHCEKNISLAYINSYLEKEAAKYNVSDFRVIPHLFGAYPLKNLEKIGDIAIYWNKDPFGVAKVQDAFENVLADNSIDQQVPSLFLYFDDSFDSAGVRSDSFYEYKKFRSFANELKGRAYINVYRFTPFFAKTVTLIVLHELLHLFGASDKYIEDSDSNRICSNKGLGDLNKTPLYPQTSGDIMCLFIEKNKDNFTRGSLTDGNLVINEITASEIGWREY